MSKQSNTIFTRPVVVTLLALLCCALWGSAYPCVKACYELFQIESSEFTSQILLAGCRFAVAGIMVIITGSIINRRFIFPRKKSLYKVGILALVQTISQYVFFYIGMANTTSVKGAIIGAVNVFMTVLISAYIFRSEKMTIMKLIACIIGFLAIVIINLKGGGMGGGFVLIGDGFLIISNLAYSFAAVLIHVFTADDDPVMLSGYQFLAGGLVMALIGVAAGGHLNPVRPSAFILLIYMSLISAVAFTVWGVLLKYNPVSRITVFFFSEPIFGVFLSALILSESASIEWGKTLIALVLVSAGIYMINRRPATRAEDSALSEK